MPRRGLVVKWILWYQWKVTTVVSQHLRYWCFVHVVRAALWNTHSAVFSIADTLWRVCVYLCVIMCQWCRTLAITSWQRGPSKQGGERGGRGWGAPGQEDLQRFRRADVPHSSNSQSQGHRRDSHTVDEGWLSSGCNPTLHCAPHSTIHSMIPSFRASVCLCVCVYLDF